MKYKNMKIEINESQPLDGVVKELERLGYKEAIKKPNVFNMIYVGSSGYYTYMYIEENLTTLTELKAMKND